MAADGLKQRLVGGAALFVIGAVAWFWLLSADSPVDPVARDTQLPPAPELQPFSVPQPVPPQGIVPVPETSTAVAAPAPVVSKPAAVEVPPPAPKPSLPKPAPIAKPVAPEPAAKPVVVKTPSETFQLDQQGLPVAWVVQVGVFATQANANRIMTELQQKGFKAYTESVRTPNGSAVKVLVGPKLSRERADAQKKAIDEALKTNTMVVRFTPA